MDAIEGIVNSLDYILDTRRKRHIMGGILLSTSLFLGGLAVTVMTIKGEMNGVKRVE